MRPVPFVVNSRRRPLLLAVALAGQDANCPIPRNLDPAYRKAGLLDRPYQPRTLPLSPANRPSCRHGNETPYKKRVTHPINRPTNAARRQSFRWFSPATVRRFSRVCRRYSHFWNCSKKPGAFTAMPGSPRAAFAARPWSEFSRAANTGEAAPRFRV